MALIHSRLGRIIYAVEDPAHGALGGSFRLHAQRSLNHHYLVYCMAPEIVMLLAEGPLAALDRR